MNSIRFVTASWHTETLYVGSALPRYFAVNGHKPAALTATLNWNESPVRITYVTGSDKNGWWLYAKGYKFPVGVVSVSLSW